MNHNKKKTEETTVYNNGTVKLNDQDFLEVIVPFWSDNEPEYIPISEVPKELWNKSEFKCSVEVDVFTVSIKLSNFKE